MKVYNIQSNAKINVGLNVVGVLENGYHSLDMVMLPIDLLDRLEIKIFENTDKKDKNLKILTNKKDIPTDSSNIIRKVYDKFYEITKFTPIKMEVFLEKNIPYQAGLGGGSSNGAKFLKFLNEYHNNILSFTELMEVGKSIGADIPFFILNKPTRVEGIGEKLSEIQNNIKNAIAIIKPSFGVSTTSAYKEMENLKNKKLSNIDKIISGLKNSDIDIIEASIENNLEEGLLNSDINLIEFKKRLLKYKNIKFFMSGSGSAYFTILPVDLNKKIKIFDELKEVFSDCELFICNFK